VFLLVFGDELLGLYGADFSEMGHLPLLVLVVGQFVNLSMGPVGTMLNMVGYEKKLFQLNMISSVMGYLLLLLLVPGLGLLGTALASMLSTLFLNIAALRIMQGQLGISWWSARHKRLVAPLVATFVLALLADTMNLVQGAWTLAMGLAAAYGTFFLVYLMGGLSQEDKEVYCMLRSRLGLGE
jgi:O-antigen/teichoic acid export membrane protein